MNEQPCHWEEPFARLIDRFERAWRTTGDSDVTPRIEEFLVGNLEAAAGFALFRELLHVDVEFRTQRGLPVDPAEYNARFPQFQVVIDELMRQKNAAEDGSARTSFYFPTPQSLKEDSPKQNGRSLPDVPGFQILEELGRGGMGVVYRARQLTLDRLVALKTILSGDYAAEMELIRFRAEARAIARLRHPNIIQIFEVGEHNGLPFFSMELCEGGSLANKLQGEPLQSHEAAALVARLALAVHATHQAGVVHRDLKPANILLVPRSQSSTPNQSEGKLAAYEVRVTDFGLAKMGEHDGLTATGAALGTPSFMAPEQAGGAKTVGPPADIYALGAILYFCLVGRPPFQAATAYETILQVLHEDPAPPRQLNRRISPDLETVTLKCLSKAPGRRYESAAELAEELQRWLDGRPIHARPVSLIETGLRWAIRHPWQTSLLFVITLATLALFAAGFYASWAIGLSRADAQASEQRRRNAERLAELTRFHSLLRQARELSGSRATGWRTAALKILKEAATLEFSSTENPSLLASELANCLIGWDVQVEKKLDTDFPVQCSAWHPDGRQVALGQVRQQGLAPCQVHLVDMQTMKVVRKLTFTPRIRFYLNKVPNIDGVERLAYSPDGRWITAVARCGDIILWDLDQRESSGKVVVKLPSGETAVAFDAESSSLLMRVGNSLISWSLKQGKEQARITRPNISAISVDPRGGRVAILCGNHIELLCTRRLVQVGWPLPHAGRPVFSPTGHTLAVFEGREVWLVDPDNPTSTRVTTLRAPGSDTTDLADITDTLFSPDGSLLLTLSGRVQHARLWDVASGQLLLALNLDQEIWGASFRPHARSFMLHVVNKSLLYSLASYPGQAVAMPGPYPVENMAMSPDGSMLIRTRFPTSNTQSMLSLWSPGNTSNPIARLVNDRMGRYSSTPLSFDPFRKEWVCGLRDNLFLRWSGQPAIRKGTWGIDARSFSCSPDGKVWAIRGNTVQLVSEPKNISYTTPLYVEAQGCSSISATRNHVVTGWNNGTLRLHQLDAQALQSRKVSSSSIQSVLLADNEVVGACGTARGDVLLFNPTDLSTVAGATVTDQHRDAVVSLSFLAPRVLLSAGRDGQIILWTWATNELRVLLQLRMPRPIQQVNTDARKRLLAIHLEHERAVRILDLRDLIEEVANLSGAWGTNQLLLPALPLAPVSQPSQFAGVETHPERNGIRAELFADPWFIHRVKVRHDTDFSLNWGKNPPDPAITSPHYSIRWTGWFAPPEKGKYRLWVGANGGFSRIAIWKNNMPCQILLGGNWEHDLDVDYDGQPIPIRFDYTKVGEEGGFKTGWSRGNHPRQEPIPKEYLFATEEDARQKR